MLHPLRYWIIALVLSVVSIGWSQEQATTPAGVARKDLGRTEKLRILVDKVMQPEEGWVTKEWMVKEAAEAGFNVFSPRSGFDRLDEVRQVTQWCAKYGIYHMPWMRGSLGTPAGPEAAGKRVVWANGSEQNLYSPNSDEFWEWTTRYVVEYAKMCAQDEHLMGVFLDYENYSPGGSGNLYQLSYDDLILGKFAEAKGIQLPKLELSQRKAWLEEQKLHEEFSKFQVNHWRERCRALRQEVDKYAPGFQFCVYPAPGTFFMVEGTWPEWGTEAAPLILADACTYGRPSKMLPEPTSLVSNRNNLKAGLEQAKAAGYHFMYAGGIDPVVRGADAEFCGKNAVMISEATDGYWIFYEGPAYKTTHKDYFKWFTWANKAIAAGNFAAQNAPRETPEDWGASLVGKVGSQAPLVMPALPGTTVKLPEARLRNENLLLLGAKAGMPVELTLKDIPVGKNEHPLSWLVRDVKLQTIQSGTIAHNTQETVQFTPGTDGPLFLTLSSGGCSYQVVSANVPVGITTVQEASFIGVVGRLYFTVPAGLTEFTITAKGWGAETIRVNVFDPEGKQVATGQTTLKTPEVTVKAPVGTGAGKVWSFQLARADEGVVEDSKVILDPALAPVLSLLPEQAFAKR